MSRLPSGMTVLSMKRMADGINAMALEISVSLRLVHSYKTYLWAFGDSDSGMWT